MSRLVCSKCVEDEQMIDSPLRCRVCSARIEIRKGEQAVRNETLAEMHARHGREIQAIEKPGAPTYSQLVTEVERLSKELSEARAEVMQFKNELDVTLHARNKMFDELTSELDKVNSEVCRLAVNHIDANKRNCEANDRADRLRAERDNLLGALRDVLGVAEWMSGSEDFGPSGTGGAYWRECQPLLSSARAAIAKVGK